MTLLFISGSRWENCFRCVASSCRTFMDVKWGLTVLDLGLPEPHKASRAHWLFLGRNSQAREEKAQVPLAPWREVCWGQSPLDWPPQPPSPSALSLSGSCESHLTSRRCTRCLHTRQSTSGICQLPKTWKLSGLRDNSWLSLGPLHFSYNLELTCKLYIICWGFDWNALNL